MNTTQLEEARVLLEACEHLVERLHKMCCEPGRSPRMEAIISALDAARAQTASIRSIDDAGVVIGMLEDIGGQIGHLQVACCTEARMPLYADALANLTATQINIASSVGQGH